MSKHNIVISDSSQYITIILNNINIIYSHDYGVTWSMQNINFKIKWTLIGMSSSGQYQTALTDGEGIYYTSNYGTI